MINRLLNFLRPGRSAEVAPPPDRGLTKAREMLELFIDAYGEDSGLVQSQRRYVEYLEREEAAHVA